MRIVAGIALLLTLAGCSRSFWRQSADRETYQAIAERNNPPWAMPRVTIDTPIQSRLYDPFNPDRPPMPPDDPAADRYMKCANGMHGSRFWHEDGDAPWIEDPGWREYLTLNDEGKLALTPERSIELALLHSRTYQSQLEIVYQTALSLTLNRYDFYLHYFATNDTNWTHFGSGADELNTLTSASTASFTKAFAAGGQLLVEFANSLVFQFAGPDTFAAPSTLTANFTQPLLRGFGRKVRMESLTQGERNLLYALRTFARFRKQFSVTIITRGYLQLLLQLQTIRNQESNLTSLDQSLRFHEALLANGSISNVEVDQVFQQYQQGRLSLLSAQTSLESQLDNYKISLGLPPSIPVSLDDSQLQPFQLNDAELTKVQDELEKLLAEFRELDQAPSLETLRTGVQRLKSAHARTVGLIGMVEGEIERWRKQPDDPDQDKVQISRNKAAQQALATQISELRKEMTDFGVELERSRGGLVEDKRKDAWISLQKQIRQQASLTSQLFVIQTQVRVYLIQLRRLKMEETPAIEYALANRLDYMNQRASVVDAWRQIAVTANALKGVANLNFNASVATLPFSQNPVDFRSSASSYTIGAHFEAPLDREVERNVYRNSQIAYEQSRRSFMALDDQIQQSIRQDLRQLETDRLNFEIARQSLVTAAKAVEAARDKLQLAENAADTTATLNILNALNNLLTVKQQLISNWVSYETDRVQLLLDIEALQVDDRGMYIDEHINQDEQPPTSAVSGGTKPPAESKF